MDTTHFTRLVDTFVATDSRRGLLRLLAALPFFNALATLLDEESEAANRRRGGARHERIMGDRRKKKKRRKKRRSSSASPPAPCVPRSCPTDSCGAMPDGCGRTLNCGGSPTNQICLISNVCQACSIICAGPTPEDCGNTLQQAFDAGGGYFVCPGLYRRQNGFEPGDQVTLIGAGQGDDATSNTILESGGNTRVLTIPGGTPPVTLERLRIRNGRLLTNSGHIFGGAVRLHEPSILHMTECTVSQNNLVNLSQSDFANGGGIAVEAGCTLEMTRCTVRENFATPTRSLGGGIWTAGTTTLTDCLVEANGAETVGGGLRVEGGKTILAGSTLVRLNTAISGAGIDVQDSVLEVAATCRVTQNMAPNGAGPGGISNTTGRVTLAGADPSPIVVNNCPDNCNGPAVPKCSTAPPVSCPP